MRLSALVAAAWYLAALGQFGINAALDDFEEELEDAPQESGERHGQTFLSLPDLTFDPHGGPKKGDWYHRRRSAPIAEDYKKWPDYKKYKKDPSKALPQPVAPTPVPDKLVRGYRRAWAADYFKRWGHWSRRGDVPNQPYNIKPEKYPR